MVTSVPVVALLESRMSRELARLVEKHGGEPLCVPAVRERVEVTPEVAGDIVTNLSDIRHEVVVFMTGLAVTLLFEMAEQIGRRPELVAALRRTTTVCRGPKPTAALRGFGVPPTLTARSSFTSAEVVDALSGLEMEGRRVLLFHYGERSHTVAETLRARGATLEERWLYRWVMPEDPAGLEALIARIIHGGVDALAITCQVQFRHLLEVAERAQLRRQLLDALNEHVVIAAVGPTCQAILEAHHVRVHVLPDHPKMGPLVAALMQYLDRNRHVGASSPENPLLPN